jgi:hypothetical protein
MSSKKGILYERLPSVDGRRGWYEGREGDEEKDKEGYPKYNKYEGEIENGKPNGNGTCTLINGATYVGQYVDGLREGLGGLSLGLFMHLMAVGCMKVGIKITDETVKGKELTEMVLF